MVVLAIVQKSTKYLIIRRKDGESNLIWLFPGGKKELTDKNEKNTAEREVLEETGVLCKATKKIGARLHPKTKVNLTYWLCDYVRGEATVKDAEEIEEVKWATREDVTSIFGDDLFIKVREYFRNSN